MHPIFFQVEEQAIFLLCLEHFKKGFLAFQISLLLPFRMSNQQSFLKRVTLPKAFYKLLLQGPKGLLNKNKFFQLPFLEICNVQYLQSFLLDHHQGVEVINQYQDL